MLIGLSINRSSKDSNGLANNTIIRLLHPNSNLYYR